MLSVKKEDVTMKKMLAAFMATALIVGSLVGCGSSTKKKKPQRATAASGETTAESTAAVEGGTSEIICNDR